MNVVDYHVIEKKRRASNKSEQYVVLPVTKEVLQEKSTRETPKAFLFDDVWIPKSLLTYTEKMNLLSLPFWWIKNTKENSNGLSGNKSRVLSPLTPTQLRNLMTDTTE